MATKDKETKRNKTFASHSITNASISKRGGYKYVSGVRLPIGVRVDTGLYNAFKPLAKRLYGSVCHAIEVYMEELILWAENPASFCYTSGKPLNIEKIVIERNLRPRRNLEVAEDVVVERTVAVAPVPKCGFYGCGKSPVVGRFRYVKTGKEMDVCEFHVKLLKDHPKWRCVNGE